MCVCVRYVICSVCMYVYICIYKYYQCVCVSLSLPPSLTRPLARWLSLSPSFSLYCEICLHIHTTHYTYTCVRV